jgi:GNAT superfamily N-acetyltransferase
MRIIDLTPEYEHLYLTCLEPWSEEMAEAGDHKARWYREHRSRGLVVKLAIDDDDGAVVGMVQALPVEETWVDGAGIDFILCIWVHGHKEGVGNRQGRGVGMTLLSALEEDARSRGRKGVAAWGLAIPVWMKASWYKKQGYRVVDRDGMATLVFKPFTDDAVAPKWSKLRPEPDPAGDAAVTVTSFVNGWCQASCISHERAKRACACFAEDQVRYVATRTYGADALFVGDSEVATGPPVSDAKLKRRIERALHGPWWRRWLRRSQ